MKAFIHWDPSASVLMVVEVQPASFGFPLVFRQLTAADLEAVQK